MLAKSDTKDRPEKRLKGKHPAAMTGDEIMDEIVGQTAREKLKELARENQPKPKPKE